MVFATHIDLASAGAIGIDDARATIDDTASRKSRARDVLHQLIDGQSAVVDQGQTGLNHFAQVVRRNIGRHTDGDTGRTVDQQVRDLGRHHSRDHLGAVIVRHPVHSFFVQVGQQFVGDLVHADFGITHCRRGVTVDGTEVPLTIHQRVAHGEILRHPHDSVIHGAVTVGVIFTDHVTDHTGRLLIGLVPVVAQFVHREQDTTVHRLQTISHVR